MRITKPLPLGPLRGVDFSHTPLFLQIHGGFESRPAQLSLALSCHPHHPNPNPNHDPGERPFLQSGEQVLWGCCQGAETAVSVRRQTDQASTMWTGRQRGGPPFNIWGSGATRG